MKNVAYFCISLDYLKRDPEIWIANLWGSLVDQITWCKPASTAYWYYCCTMRHGFRFKDSLEMVDHICASAMAAILDWIAKLLDMHQQQVLCYCCTSYHWFWFKDGFETIDPHIDDCPDLNYSILYFCINSAMTAILDQIVKLFDVHQLQVLCYCCT